jgi:site-specific DNA-methyltransferase (adenine-specific)
MKAQAIYFVKGRLKFGNGGNSAPFPSAVVVFNGNEPGFPAMGMMKANE